MSEESLSNLLFENRTFPPSPEFIEEANISASAYAEADSDFIAFWEKQAQRLTWFKLAERT